MLHSRPSQLAARPPEEMFQKHLALEHRSWYFCNNNAIAREFARNIKNSTLPSKNPSSALCNLWHHLLHSMFCIRARLCQCHGWAATALRGIPCSLLLSDRSTALALPSFLPPTCLFIHSSTSLLRLYSLKSSWYGIILSWIEIFSMKEW